MERLTDELAGEPWRVLGADGCARFAEVVAPLMMAVVTSGILPTASILGIGHRTAGELAPGDREVVDQRALTPAVPAS